MTRREIYDKYKEVCPNSIDVYNPTDRNLDKWNRFITLHEKNKRISDANISAQQKEDLRLFYEESKKRAWKSIKDIPKRHIKNIKICVDKILKKYPKTVVVYLQGSFAKGTFVDGDTRFKYRRMRTRITGKTNNSDYDFYIVPSVSDVNFDGTNDIMPREDNNKILIWEKT